MLIDGIGLDGLGDELFEGGVPESLNVGTSDGDSVLMLSLGSIKLVFDLDGGVVGQRGKDLDGSREPSDGIGDGICVSVKIF